MKKPILAISIAAFTLGVVSQNAAAEAIRWANGTWAMDATQTNGGYRCDAGVAEMKISDNGKTFSFETTSGKTNQAKVLETHQNYLSLRYVRPERSAGGQDRRNVIMYFIDQNTFVWIPTDKFVPGTLNGATPRRVRCQLFVS